jgi:DNA-binding LytR/AlgR family response regulator
MAKLQVDMSCINSTIIREISRQVDLDRLDILKERKDKLVSRLFMKKLEVLLEKEQNYLHRCAFCL